MNEALELRVLSGLHREARCPALHNDLVGADSDCDIILTDPGMPARAARLRLADEGWELAPADDDGADDGASAPPGASFNQPRALGHIWITVSRLSDPWAEPPEAANDPSADAVSDPDARPADLDEDAEPVPLPLRTDPRPATAAHAPVPPRRRRSRVTTSALTAAGLAILIALAQAWLSPPPTAPSAPERPDPRSAAERSLPLIQATLDRLGMASRLRAAMTSDGAAQVSGWVRTEAERDALASALTQIWPMPAMKVSVEADVLRTARAALEDHAVKYEPRYDGEGRLSILGIAAGDADRAAAVEAVRAKLPGIVIMDNAVLSATAVADILTRELAEAGLGGVVLSWDRHHLLVNTSDLDDAQAIRFEAILAEFNHRFFDVATPPDSGLPADSVPFGIRSVIGGHTPFIVLENGRKLLVGGIYRRYRLTGIEEHRLTFDGPRHAIVPR
ncbi:type III secretion system inner membrane ring subunit SctD [Castellaniella sp. WN]